MTAVQHPWSRSLSAMATIRADVLIAGRGPGGLAAALALRRSDPKLRIRVFEGSSGYHMQGSRVLFNPNGQKALEAIDPAVLVKLRDGGVPPHNLKRYTIHGKKAEAMPFRDNTRDLPERYGYKRFLTGWHEIRQALYKPVADLVQFEHKAVRYDADDEGVTLHFQQGNSVRGSALVICDGYWSRLRQQCLGDGPPNFAGTVIGAELKVAVGKLGLLCSAGGVLEKLSQRGLDLDVPPARGWVEASVCHALLVRQAWLCLDVRGPLKELEARGITYDAGAKQMMSVHHEATDLSAQQNCLKVFADYPEEMHSMVANTDCSTITQHGLYMRDINSLPRQWGKGLVTFVGDSMHATIPNGQGMMLTIEDAAVLAWHLQQGGLNAESLRRYEAERTPRIQDVVKHGHDGATYEDNERLHYAVKFNSLQPLKSW